MMKRQNTYQRDPAAAAQAEAELRRAIREPSGDGDWQDDLPEVPDDEDPEAVEVEVFE